ncbi:copia protein [Tanacetum coccineum]
MNAVGGGQLNLDELSRCRDEYNGGREISMSRLIWSFGIPNGDHAYADADYAGCQDTRKSTSGSAQFLRDKLVSWSSKKQKSTDISTYKAEIYS